jgi:predicted ATPase
VAYKYSQLDKSNLAWFDKDASKTTLIRFEIRTGSLRGLSNLKLQFRYPITAISGKNGTGKSTILACVACAFHNHSGGYKSASRRLNYYTLSDFFVQSSEEVTPNAIVMAYQILHDKWRKTSNVPTGIGLGWQFRVKKFLGKWNNYDSRARRNVVYLGIERVVPHAEKSVSKSYRHIFQKVQSEGYEREVRDTVGKILGRSYDDFYFKKHYKYRLPLVQSRGQVYSGFNMGTGENALFEIFSTIYACPDSLLLVIDELELGLHEEAQVRLVEELKKICKVRHVQIVCTTHSPRIISALPPEARIHLERQGSSTKIIPDISADYAAGLMSGISQAELDVFCEDDIAKDILSLALTNDLRSRIRILPIGSAAAVARHLAAKYKENSTIPVCGFLDGDKGLDKREYVKLFLKSLEKVTDQDEATLWVENRLAFLPGNTWPERWVILKYGCKSFHKLTDEFGVSQEALVEYVEAAKSADKHDELYELSKKLSLPISTVKGRFIKCALEDSLAEVESICKFLQGFL